MSKQALCMPRSAVNIDFEASGLRDIPDGFFGLPTLLVGRDLCEKDESLLQLIPYIVLRNAAGKVFCYERGAGGGERGLHAKLSIGLGGHVDVAPTADQSLWHTLCLEAGRELREEVGVEADVGDYVGGFSALLYNGADDVGRVHLGLLTEVLAGDGEIEAEAGSIENGRWLGLIELLRPDVFERLEPWSQMVVTDMLRKMSADVGWAMFWFGELLSVVNIESTTGVTSAANQEVSQFLLALGRNLTRGHAQARIYDDEGARDALDSLGRCKGQLAHALGLA